MIKVLLLALATHSALTCESDARELSSTEGPQTLIEREPTAATGALFEELINGSAKVEVYFTPVEFMGRVGFSHEMAEQRAKYVLEYRCHAGCGIELQDLRRRLSTGRRLSGNCPRPISTVMHFFNREGSRIESVVVSANGQCFSIRDNAYFLDSQNSIEGLVDGLRHVLVP